MIKLERTETFGFEAAIRGMRNPLNSWDKSDSEWVNGCVNTACTDCVDEEYCRVASINPDIIYKVGENDLDLMKRLVKAGTDHSKFMRMITVYVDITAPLYWWKEFDTYKVGTVANSCSTMHKIHAKEFTINDFSHEHLLDGEPLLHMYVFLSLLNDFRELYIETKDKKYWWQMIQLLPSSYNQKRTVQLNYAVLRNMYHARKNHKLDEWRDFCKWIESLPCSELITME